MQKINFRKTLPVLLVVLIIGILGFSTYYFYRQYKAVTKNPQLVSQQEARVITDKISKFMELPTGEDPTLATVTDKEKLKDQPFFLMAQNGDRVLIYTKARKAILYRMTTNKVIEVAPLTIGNGQLAAPTSGQPQQIRVAIYNGSTKVGLSSTIEKKVVAIAQGIQVVSKTNASKNNYTDTVVIDLSGKYGDIATGMAQLLGGKVSSIPAGEKIPDADILIIVAK